MVYIPHNQIYEMVDFLYTGSINRIYKAKLETHDNVGLNLDITKDLVVL